jgi:hypothetical protein
VPLFGGLLTAMLNDVGRIVAVESFWDHGGLPIRSLHGNNVGGSFVVGGSELRTESFQLRQRPDNLTLWFSSGNDLPRPHWTIQRDFDLHTTLYFSQRTAKGGWPVPSVGGRAECHLLAGIALGLEKTVARHPITIVRVHAEDFK